MKSRGSPSISIVNTRRLTFFVPAQSAKLLGKSLQKFSIVNKYEHFIEALKQNACLELIVSLIECCKKTLRNVSWSGRKINQRNSRLNNRQKIRNVRIFLAE